MKVISLLFITFLATSYASQAVFQGLAQIDKDPFGSTILNAIALNLKAKQSVADVSALLDEMLQDALVDQRALEDYYASTKGSLLDSIRATQDIISTLQATIAALEESIATDTTNLDIASQDLEQTKQRIVEEQENLDRLVERCSREIPEWDLDIGDVIRAQDAITDAINKLNAYKASSTGGASLLQLASTAQQDLKTVTTTVENMRVKLSKQSNLYTPLMRELIDLSASVNQSNVDSLLALLAQLQDLLGQALYEGQTSRAVLQEYCDTTQNQIEDELLRLRTLQATLEETIENLYERIRAARESLAEASALLVESQANLAALQAELQKLENYYADQTPRYERVVALLGRIIDYFNENVAAVDEYTRSRIEAQAL